MTHVKYPRTLWCASLHSIRLQIRCCSASYFRMQYYAHFGRQGRGGSLLRFQQEHGRQGQLLRATGVCLCWLGKRMFPDMDACCTRLRVHLHCTSDRYHAGCLWYCCSYQSCRHPRTTELCCSIWYVAEEEPKRHGQPSCTGGRGHPRAPARGRLLLLLGA